MVFGVAGQVAQADEIFVSSTPTSANYLSFGTSLGQNYMYLEGGFSIQTLNTGGNPSLLYGAGITSGALAATVNLGPITNAGIFQYALPAEAAGTVTLVDGSAANNWTLTGTYTPTSVYTVYSALTGKYTGSIVDAVTWNSLTETGSHAQDAGYAILNANLNKTSAAIVNFQPTAGLSTLVSGSGKIPYTGTLSVVPAPSSLIGLLSLGVVGLAFAFRRWR